MMLDPMKVLHIERLLAQNEFSQRQIARLAGVSRPAVAAIAAAQRRRDGDQADSATPSHPTRCRGCGGLVFLPCRACQLRTWLNRKKAVDGVNRSRLPV